MLEKLTLFHILNFFQLHLKINNLSYHIKCFWWSCPTAFPQIYAIEIAHKKTSRADVSGQKQNRSTIRVLVQEILPSSSFFVFSSFTNTWLTQFSKFQSSTIIAGKKKDPSPKRLPPGQLTWASFVCSSLVICYYRLSSKQTQPHKSLKFPLHQQMFTCAVLFAITD